MGFIGTDKITSKVGKASIINGVCDSNNVGYAVFQTVNDPFSLYGGSALEQNILASHEVGHLIGAAHDPDLINGKPSIMNDSTSSNNVLKFTNESIGLINAIANSCL